MTVVRVKGFKIYRDCRQKMRCYHRKTDEPVDLEKNPIGSAGFFAECARISALAEAKVAEREKSGTLGALVCNYRKSSAFRDNLAPRTQVDYQKVFDYLRPIAGTPLVRFNRPLVVRIRDKAAETKGKRFGNYVKAGLSIIFTWGCERGFLENYVSQALLQNCKAEAGSIARVPAPETEKLVCDGVRRHLAAMGKEPPAGLAERELIERHVARVSVTPQALDICLLSTSGASAQTEGNGLPDPAPSRLPTTTITLPWTPPSFVAVKGVLHTPSAKPAMRPENRDALLAAIAKARRWIDDMRLGRIPFDEIATREAQGERHIRLLAPLAFLSPRIIAAVVDGTAPTDSTVTGLAKALPHSWAEQERRIGSPRSTKRSISASSIGAAVNATWPARGAALEIRQKRLRFPHAAHLWIDSTTTPQSLQINKIADRGYYFSVLQPARVMPGLGERKATRMTQHVRMHAVAEACGLARARDQLVYSITGERRAALADKHRPMPGRTCVPVHAAQGPQLIASNWMCRRCHCASSYPKWRRKPVQSA